jgi:hypothetical protein
MSKDSDTGVRIRLDARVPLESMVLNRLHILPRTRRDEWLRRLLILGFRSECQSLKSTQSSQSAKPRLTARTDNPGESRQTKVVPIRETSGVHPAEKAALWGEDDTTSQHQTTAENPDAKPFAQLKAVMG